MNYYDIKLIDSISLFGLDIMNISSVLNFICKIFSSNWVKYYKIITASSCNETRIVGLA